MELFANIGKAVLVQSLGLQKNYTEVASDTVEVIDYDTPQCRECKCCAVMKSFKPGSEAYIAASKICEGCTKKTTATQTIGHNAGPVCRCLINQNSFFLNSSLR